MMGEIVSVFTEMVSWPRVLQPEYQAFISRGVGEGSNRQRKAWHKGLHCSLPSPHSVTSVSELISQSDLFVADMSTLHTFCVHQKWQRRLFLISFEFQRIFAQLLFASKIFTQSMESVSPQYCCLLKLLTKRFLKFCVKNLSFLWNYNCLSWELLIFKIVKMEKGLLAKKCAGKIVNCYRMFAELQEALAGGGALDKAERLLALSAPGHKHLRQSFIVQANDFATEVTPKASSTCKHEAEGVQRRPSTKRALFSYQYSELEDEMTSPISRADKNLRRTSFPLTSRLSRHNFCSFFLV